MLAYASIRWHVLDAVICQHVLEYAGICQHVTPTGSGYNHESGCLVRSQATAIVIPTGYGYLL